MIQIQRPSRWEMLAVLTLVTTAINCCRVSAATHFQYEKGQPVAGQANGIRVHQVKVGPVKQGVYVYATFEMGPHNPIPYVDDLPQGRQLITLGQIIEHKFVPAVRFGMRDAKLSPSIAKDKGFMTSYLSDGKLEYYGMWLRPNTPYDFKLRLDLTSQRMTAWCCRQGDDQWYLFAENAPLMNEVTEIGQVRVEQFPGAAGIGNLTVKSKPWPPRENVQPHPLAKSNRVVGPGRGFKFQSMRSTWLVPGRHVSVCRKQGLHFGFPDVARADDNSLVCVFRNSSHTSGQGSHHSLCISHDLGQTWSEPTANPGGERIQRLDDGTLLQPGVDNYHSADGGTSWAKLFSIDRVQAGGSNYGIDGRVTELPDGSWVISSTAMLGNKQFVEVFRSVDRGQNWAFLSSIDSDPVRSNSEPSILVLRDGRLVLFAREVRTDGFAGIKAFSRDNGKTWKWQELPFAVTGRTCAGLLRDGRVMLTFRSLVGRSALWAWVGEPDDATPYLAAGVHFNDRHSVGLKDGVLHIDSDGVCGQHTAYFLRQPDSAKTVIDVTVEVKVTSNEGRAATLSVPLVGKFRFFPDRVEFAHNTSTAAKWTASVTHGEFHTYRAVRHGAMATLYIDGELAWETDKVDQSVIPLHATPVKEVSVYRLGFGNESESKHPPRINDNEISPKVTGYSTWRRAELVLDDPQTGRFAASWSADRDGFPDQYQLDHIIEVEATVVGNEQGYSGWVQLDDGRIFVVAYTDDAAPMVWADPETVAPWPRLGIPWIRGTNLLLSDLPAPSS